MNARRGGNHTVAASLTHTCYKYTTQMCVSQALFFAKSTIILNAHKGKRGKEKDAQNMGKGTQTESKKTRMPVATATHARNPMHLYLDFPPDFCSNLK